MPQQFTPDQAEKLKSLGIEIKPENIVINPINENKNKQPEVLIPTPKLPPLPTIETIKPTEPTENLTSLSREVSPIKSEAEDFEDNRPVKGDVDLSTEGLTPSEKIKSVDLKPDKKKIPTVFPLLSISGLTLLSFGGLILLKGDKTNSPTINSSQTPYSDVSVTPTQVPKSIQHYLLTSQQYFSQAVSQQKTTDSSSTIELLNNSILAATEAIKEFPDDYRGYQQRANIYQSLTDSKPDLIDQSISDFITAYKLNSNSADITRSLASLYAKKGDTQNTIAYLNQTVTLEPTKAQNFYDLAKIQQQAGLLSQAINTYNQLITIITDSAQKTQVESEKSALEKLLAQNPRSSEASAQESQILPPTTSLPSSEIETPTIQASAGSSLIIAAPEKDASITVTDQTESNSLSGNATLLSGQKDMTINNKNISSTSQVYVTVTKGGKNQNLQVLSKANQSFVVGLDSSISEDIEFKWWIIN